MNRAVTDTHALIWYALGRPARLGRRARRWFERADEGQAVIHVPAMVLVELGEAARRGVVRLEDGLESWAGRLFATGSFFPADLTVAVVTRAESLYDIVERGDRLIAATAAELGVPLLTRDRSIVAAGVQTVW